MSIFEKASRLRLRFGSTKGGSAIMVEDLWYLPLTSTVGSLNLDDLAREFHRQLKNDDNVSFVDPERKSDEKTQLKFDIVRHIIDVKLAENAAAKQERDLAEKKQRYMEIIDRKEAQVLLDKPLEELKKEFEAL